MTNPPGFRTAVPLDPQLRPATSQLGAVRRWKLTEPVRLYLYSVAVVIVAGLSLAGYLTGEWQAYATAAAAVLLGVAPAAEAARASVYSPRGVIEAVQAAMTARD